MDVTHIINMDLVSLGVRPIVDATQGEAYVRKVQFVLLSGGKAFDIPTDAHLSVRFRKPSGKGGEYDVLPDNSPACQFQNNVITVTLTPQVFTEVGTVKLDVRLMDGTDEISTFPVLIKVHDNAEAEKVESEDYYRVSGFLPMPATAEEGHLIYASQVDENGVIRAAGAKSINDAVVHVATNHTQDLTQTEETTKRYTFPVTGLFTAGTYIGYRVNRIGVKVSPGITVRFSLYEVHRNEDNTGTLKLLNVIGDAVADSETGVASLSFENGYFVTQDNTLIMASAETADICCFGSTDSGLSIQNIVVFDDANTFDSEIGTEISCSFSAGEAVEVWWSLFAVDVDYIAAKTLYQYIREAAMHLAELDGKTKYVLPPISFLDDNKVVTVMDGTYVLQDLPESAGLPEVTAEDNGKFLRVVGDAWAAVELQDVSEVGL